MKDLSDASVEVPVRVIEPIKAEWKCPECHETHVDFRFSLPARFPVQCPKTGKTFLAVR